MAVPGKPARKKRQAEGDNRGAPRKAAARRERFVGNRRAYNVQHKKTEQWRKSGKIEAHLSDETPSGRGRAEDGMKIFIGASEAKNLDGHGKVYQDAGNYKGPTLTDEEGPDGALRRNFGEKFRPDGLGSIAKGSGL